MFAPERILIAMDSFKGTLSALDACTAVSEGLTDFDPKLQTTLLPLADGGAGTVEAVLTVLKGQRRHAIVLDPLGRPIEVTWGRLMDRETAVIEMAAASGLTLLKPEERDPRRTTSYGTGQLIMEAIAAGCKRILLGIGDSATIDGGLGACQALGVRFYDAEEVPISRPITGGMLSLIHRVDPSCVRILLENVELEVLSDVNNPLLGSDGAARVFGPQKGAESDVVEELERAMAHAFQIVERDSHCAVRDLPGAGAAGGLGAAAVGLLNARMALGSETILDIQEFSAKLDACDLVLTGEGSLDEQSLHGKGPGQVARLAREAGKPIAILAGRVALREETRKELGAQEIRALHSAAHPDPTPSEAYTELRAGACHLISDLVSHMEPAT